MSTADQDHMRRAIELARRNLGLTAPNPAVGCVIVRDGQVVGEGATAPGGRPHAEEQALDRAGEAARGATAYVTLEPCGARSAGGLSCSERLVAAGVARVLIACEDASPFAAGQGAERLRAAGVEVQPGVCAAEAQVLYAAYDPAAIYPNRPK
ncbi:bifunctional diaminohydroxyphosphoribosylaminopyrimidine deaminase/5-amino-6-(5-phosphoribosylamino)uracil reductase RibD [Phenylobacterium sp.]|uniref:bifunctional diaminohydroxyphosphoribosylaminopyrimidine deaminase/5-amino-6-(5-phosphoribosylamino)uracil reductase RibD n=1 Tax=Phenylobacterium sp. TaxID=1871053 RepID=UPI002734731C|nr:bifunctional diaminohydroxyphosphoribosylaminopyrimidine deaminase/5-amino-6-(5-phosphoribosylamino)uracil reductase RibD [Phenylobacterium sp.]MDP3854865.1 bifunctional diaminohydroxyphosphoribosylaminopyrimidine deaminase/5-amino-6-(5-phosphoribosylamino)uracil reductase RibD [Phenylobacterium sp.]